jgi:hypothetical protein
MNLLESEETTNFKERGIEIVSVLNTSAVQKQLPNILYHNP